MIRDTVPLTVEFMIFNALHRSSLLAYLCIYQLPQQFGLSAYPAFGPAAQFQADWVLHILARSDYNSQSWALATNVEKQRDTTVRPKKVYLETFLQYTYV